MDPERVALIGQVIGLGGMILVTGIMFILRAKQRREKAKRDAQGFTPPATPETDQHDWHGAPASKPR